MMELPEGWRIISHDPLAITNLPEGMIRLYRGNRKMKFKDLDILRIGHEIQITGLVLTDRNDHNYVASFPGDSLEQHLAWLDYNDDLFEGLQMDADDWTKFLYQSDNLEVQLDTPEKKAVVRKSQRQIDAAVSWEVFERDGYRCRYCGQKAPLTVDHIIRWEVGGPSVKENLISACRKCNRTRGAMDYEPWMYSTEYARISAKLTAEVRAENYALIKKLPELERLKVRHVRAR